MSSSSGVVRDLGFTSLAKRYHDLLHCNILLTSDLHNALDKVLMLVEWVCAYPEK